MLDEDMLGGLHFNDRRYLQDAFATDVRDAVGVWRESRGLPLDPHQALRETGYIKRITKERAGRETTGSSSYA